MGNWVISDVEMLILVSGSDGSPAGLNRLNRTNQAPVSGRLSFFTQQFSVRTFYYDNKTVDLILTEPSILLTSRDGTSSERFY